MPTRVLLICFFTLSLVGGCGGGRPGGTVQVVAGTPVGDADFLVEINNTRAFDTATYTITFITGPEGALQGGNTITVTAPVGTDFSEAGLAWTMSADGQNVFSNSVTRQSTEPEQALNRFILNIGGPVAAGAEVVITATWINNPGPLNGGQLFLSTTSEPAIRRSNTYHINGVGRSQWVTWEDPNIPPYQCLGQATGSTDCRQRGYLVYDPSPVYKPGRPLLVDLHGCSNTAANEVRWSRFHELAVERDFVVLNPQQSLLANGARCWNWFSPDHQHRDGGEPGLIAGMIRDVAMRYGTDPNRTYIAGISAGGVMTSIMLVTYPKLFAAGAVLAGCQYRGAPCFGGPSTQPPAVAAQLAIDEMGSRVRAIPLFAITGDLDRVVPPENAETLVQQWLAIYGFTQTGIIDPVPKLPDQTETVSMPNGRTYTDDKWHSDTNCLIARRWTVHQMAHQWAGSPDNGSPQDALVADPGGPDLRSAIVDFFLARSKITGCL